MKSSLHLYLFTLEITQLEVGATYNTLPSHLTLISRFYSHEPPTSIVDRVSGLFNETRCIELIFEQTTRIGPKHTSVHLIQPNTALRKLHTQLSSILDGIGVDYSQPEYINEGWKPHVSERKNDGFASGFSHVTKAAYLIEVFKEGESHLRNVQNRFNLSN